MVTVRKLSVSSSQAEILERSGSALCAPPSAHRDPCCPRDSRGRGGAGAVPGGGTTPPRSYQRRRPPGAWRGVAIRGCAPAPCINCIPPLPRCVVCGACDPLCRPTVSTVCALLLLHDTGDTGVVVIGESCGGKCDFASSPFQAAILSTHL